MVRHALNLPLIYKPKTSKNTTPLQHLKKPHIFIISLLFIVSIALPVYVYGNDVWADFFGTSSTSGTWDTGTRYNPNTTMKPPLVLLWQSYDWRGNTINVNPTWNGASIVNGVVYYGEGSQIGIPPGYLWAWDSATGITKTGFPLQTLNGIGDTPCILGEYIGAGTLPIEGTGNNYLWDSLSLNIISGFPVTVAANTEIEGSPIIQNNRIYFCNGDTVGTNNYYLYCYDTTTGNLIYKNPLPAYGSDSTPFIYQGKIIITNWNTGLRVYCFNESDGSTVPGYPLQLSANGGTNASPVVYNNRIYIDSGEAFWAIDINTATVPAPFPLTITGGNMSSTIAAGNGKVYFGTAGGYIYGNYLYGIDATTGANIAGFPVTLNGSANIDGPITLANGVAYFGTDENKVYAVDANNGTNLWSYQLPAGIGYSGIQYIMASVAENKLAVTSVSGNGVFVFCMPSPTITPTITETATPTMTETITPTMTYTNTSTLTGTYTITATITQSQTISQTTTETITPTISMTSTITQTLIIC